MTMPARLAALAAVVALVLAGALAFAGSGGGPTSTPLPSAATEPSTAPSVLETVGLPVLDASFTSPRHGYTVKYPSAWSVEPATKAWLNGGVANWGDPAVDELRGSDIRLSATQQKFLAGQTEDQWMRAYCELNDAADCPNVPASWPRTKVSGADAYLTLDDVPAAGGTIKPGGRVFEVVVPTRQRAYVFTLDGAVDRAVLDSILASVELAPVDAIDLPELSDTFTSPTYGYSIPVAPDWTTTPATTPWKGIDNSPPVVDQIEIAGTDTGLTGASQALPKGTTYEDWLVTFHEPALHNNPAGCDGGDPSTWPPIQIGDRVGGLEMFCNAAEAVVNVDGRVYVFDWGNSTFDGDRHLSFASWKHLLQSVRFDPASAK